MGRKWLGVTLPQVLGRNTKRIESCWLWIGSATDRGYGQFWFNGKPIMAHRAAYEIAKGPIPKDLVIDHLCRVHRCVNPDHLEVVTRGENVLRGIGPGAINKTKTHCKRGHEFTVENTYIYKGTRNCRSCALCRAEAGRLKSAHLGQESRR